MKRVVAGISFSFLFCLPAVAGQGAITAEANFSTRPPCIPSYAASQSYKGVSVARVSALSQVGCPRLTAPGSPNVDYPPAAVAAGQRQHQPTELPPPTPTSCGYRMVVEPVAVVAAPNGKIAQWNLPEGGTDHANEFDMASTPPPASGLQPPQYAVAIIGQFPLFARLESNDTTYGGDHGWQCKGGTWKYRDHCTDFSAPSLQACLFVGPPASVTAPPSSVPDPQPFIQAELASIRGMVDAGHQGTSPSDPTRQFVNLPSCWWLTGTQGSQAFDLQIQTPPDASGRSMTYVYRIEVGLQDVHWDYGDGATYNGDAGHPYSDGSCSNPHTYERVSRVGSPGATGCPGGYPRPTSDDGCYRVQATETYAATITAYWWDGVRTGGPLDMGAMAPIVLQPPPTFVRVLQIEGVPVTP